LAASGRFWCFSTPEKFRFAHEIVCSSLPNEGERDVYWCGVCGLLTEDENAANDSGTLRLRASCTLAASTQIISDVIFSETGTLVPTLYRCHRSALQHVEHVINDSNTRRPLTSTGDHAIILTIRPTPNSK